MALDTQIEQAATDPAAASVDGQSVTAKPVADLILADQYLTQKAAARKRLRGIAITRLITPGALPDAGAPLSFGGGCG